MKKVCQVGYCQEFEAYSNLTRCNTSAIISSMELSFARPYKYVYQHKVLVSGLK